MDFLQLIFMVLRYLVSAVITVLATLLTWLLTVFPVLPVLSFTTKNGNLPRWCYWLQTHDNPLDSLWIGEEGATHRRDDANDYRWLYKYTNQQIAQSFWLRFFARAFWLIRNPAYGVANAFGINKAGLVELRHIKGEQYEFWLYKTARGFYGFRLYALLPWLFGRAMRVYLGWKPIGDEPRMMLATHINPFRKK
jgi:hypothetical protein